MAYRWEFRSLFATEFGNLPPKDQDKVLDFITIYLSEGLQDFSKYEGKIAPSWSGTGISPFLYSYAVNHALWHYHVGIPSYSVRHTKYKTSDFLLHFQWPNMGDEIYIVDLYSHYTSDGHFYLPPERYLA